MADGDLTARIPVSSQGEIEEVAESFNDMMEHLSQTMGQILSSSGRVAVASGGLKATAERISSGAEMMASQVATFEVAGKEMSETSEGIANNCNIASEASLNTSQSANAGALIIDETIAGMKVISTKVQNTSITIKKLGDHSGQISEIIGTIEDIADQTNLLALNAAIEAARAGDQGRGFAVVADEVRALAERTTKATHEIGNMINTIQKMTTEAVRSMEEGVEEVERGALSSQRSGQALREILSRIDEVSQQITQIATAANEQTATAQAVNSNINHVTEGIQKTTQGISETAQAADLMSEQASNLQNLVNNFRLA